MILLQAGYHSHVHSQTGTTPPKRDSSQLYIFHPQLSSTTGAPPQKLTSPSTHTCAQTRDDLW